MKELNQKENCLVSIIIPTYNRAYVLPRAIKSVLKQTYHEFELIIVDDGSSDNTFEVIKHYLDERINYIKLDYNRGQSSAMNVGIKACHGIYITFLDDDDELAPQMLEIETGALNNTTEKIGFAIGLGINFKDEKIGYFNKNKYSKKKDLLKAQLQFCAFSLSGVLIKRDCFEKVGYINENFVLGNDWEFMLRLLKKYDYIHVNQLVYKAHYEESLRIQHICNKSTEIFPQRLKTYKLILTTYLQDIKQSRRISAKYYFRIAQILYHYKKFNLSSKYFKFAFQINPLNLRYLFYFSISQFRHKLYFFYQLEQQIFQKLGKNIVPKKEISLKF